jgi:hypothetical protein
MRRLMMAMAVGAAMLVANCGDDDEPGPTHTYDDDRAAIQAIIDANGLTGTVFVNDVATFDGASGLAKQLNLRPSQINQAGPIDTLPPEVGVLTALTHLYIDSNAVRSLPGAISSLGGLQHLYASQNQLSALPTQLFSVRSLRTLKVNGNVLGALPAGVGSLTAMQSLDVSKNQLDTLPDALTSLTALQAFNFDSNTVCNGLSPTLTAWISQFGYTEQWRTYQVCP